MAQAPGITLNKKAISRMSLSTAEAKKVSDKMASLLKVLSHPDRMLICCALRQREMAVNAISEELDLHQPRLSRELAKLRDEGFVTTRKESRVVFYQLSDQPDIYQLLDAICAVALSKPELATDFKAKKATSKGSPTKGASVFPKMAT